MWVTLISKILKGCYRFKLILKQVNSLFWSSISFSFGTISLICFMLLVILLSFISHSASPSSRPFVFRILCLYFILYFLLIKFLSVSAMKSPTKLAEEFPSVMVECDFCQVESEVPKYDWSTRCENKNCANSNGHLLIAPIKEKFK